VGGYHKNVITLAPNLMISHEEIELAISLLGQLLARAERR
jgi:4-aminobutyrate aminotransferase-like enzyme